MNRIIMWARAFRVQLCRCGCLAGSSIAACSAVTTTATKRIRAPRLWINVSFEWGYAKIAAIPPGGNNAGEWWTYGAENDLRKATRCHRMNNYRHTVHVCSVQ